MLRTVGLLHHKAPQLKRFGTGKLTLLVPTLLCKAGRKNQSHSSISKPGKNNLSLSRSSHLLSERGRKNVWDADSVYYLLWNLLWRAAGYLCRKYGMELYINPVRSTAEKTTKNEQSQCKFSPSESFESSFPHFYACASSNHSDRLKTSCPPLQVFG